MQSLVCASSLSRLRHQFIAQTPTRATHCSRKTYFVPLTAHANFSLRDQLIAKTPLCATNTWRKPRTSSPCAINYSREVPFARPTAKNFALRQPLITQTSIRATLAKRKPVVRQPLIAQTILCANHH
ncbi:hypothetical protein L6452_36145 [Arctium lappa]|uniref:Uncharacterized protein n=1 Tax=Arctium lappa TaxID=4217 RepID=A0ACB8YCL2_ARCLA|nr:hypothetical protein L6452_36145 [Arctium lappa]